MRTFDCNREKQSKSNPTTPPATPPERTEATQLESSYSTNPITPAEYIFRSAMVISEPKMSPYDTVEVGLSKREQFAASKRDRFAASSNGRSLMSMGCSGRSLLSMDLALRSQDFGGSLGSLMNGDDFDDVEDELLPEFKALRDISPRDLSAGKTDTMTSEYVEPLASLPEDQEHKSCCPVLKLTARLERVSTCENVDLLNENFRVTSRDWGMPVQQTDYFPEPPTSYNKHSDRDWTKPVVVGMGPAGGIKYPNANVASMNNVGKNSSSSRPSAESLGHEEFGISCQSELHMDFPPSSSDKMTPTSPASSISKIAKTRRVIDTSCSVDPTDNDVLLGRGGFTNTHPGNISFRDKALELRSWYEASDKEQKFQISKLLLESVTGQGNRFLERGDDGLWHEVVGDGARKKASQALRERIKGSRKNTAT